MRVFLVRHAQTSWNAAGRAQGSTDIPLDHVGVAQAEALGRAMADIRLSAVLSSDLQRCVETATAISKVTGAKIETTPHLRERSMAEWEGLPFEELRLRLRDCQSEDDPFGLASRSPSGETILDVWARLQPVVDLIQATDSNVAIVSHGGTSALLLAKLIRGEPPTARAFRFSNAAITELVRHAGGHYLIERLNDGEHLQNLDVFDGSASGTMY